MCLLSTFISDWKFLTDTKRIRSTENFKTADSASRVVYAIFWDVKEVGSHSFRNHAYRHNNNMIGIVKH